MNLLGGLLSVIFTILSDHAGRLFILKIAMTFFLLSSGILSFVTGYYANTVLNIILWLSMDVLVPLTYVYYTEISSGQLRQKSNIIIVLSSAFGAVLCPVVNIGITHFKMIYIINFPLFFFLKQTPYYLFNKNRIKDFQRVLMEIWQTNQKKPINVSEENKFAETLAIETEKLIKYESENLVTIWIPWYTKFGLWSESIIEIVYYHYEMVLRLRIRWKI